MAPVRGLVVAEGGVHRHRRPVQELGQHLPLDRSTEVDDVALQEDGLGSPVDGFDERCGGASHRRAVGVAGLDDATGQPETVEPQVQVVHRGEAAELGAAGMGECRGRSIGGDAVDLDRQRHVARWGQAVDDQGARPTAGISGPARRVWADAVDADVETVRRLRPHDLGVGGADAEHRGRSRRGNDTHQAVSLRRRRESSTVRVMRSSDWSSVLPAWGTGCSAKNEAISAARSASPIAVMPLIMRGIELVG